MGDPVPYSNGTWTWHILWSWQIEPGDLHAIQYVDQRGELRIQGDDGAYAITKAGSGYRVHSPSWQVEETQ